MPVAVALSEEVVRQLAPDDSALRTAQGLKSKFSRPAVSADGTWLLGQCAGSARDPYEVSVDLANPSAPVGRCTCPSRKLPCKHVLGLMLLYTQTPQKFSEREPPAELLAKRERLAQRAEKKATGEAKPRKVNQAALAKKTAAQRDGLDLLERLLIDLVDGGSWFEPANLERLERQARQMSDAYLPGALIMLRRLVLLGHRTNLADEERNALAADLIGHLWATVQKGRNYLDGKLAGDEAQAEADAVIEEVLGKAWQLTELRDKGYVRQNLRLMELAYERRDDDAREERIETSHLLGLDDGALFRAITYRPFKGLTRIPGQADYPGQLVSLSEAAVYPGFLNRRVRWEPGAQQFQPLEPEHLKAAYGLAAPEFDKPLADFRKQLKHPLAAREAVVLLRCRRVGRIGERVALEDAKGARLEAVDRDKDYSNIANLVRAAGELEQPAVLVRLFVLPVTNALVAQPLAALTGTKHLRLGL
jgi:hypothetical protein